MKRLDKDTHCAQGHELIGDNVRTVKVCRACNHERVRGFRERKEAGKVPAPAKRQSA
jgi:hypothetical protein